MNCDGCGSDCPAALKPNVTVNLPPTPIPTVRPPSTQSYPTQSYPTQSYPTQSYPTQSYPTQSYPTQNYPTYYGYPSQSYPTYYGYPTQYSPSSYYYPVCGYNSAYDVGPSPVPSPKCPEYYASYTNSASQYYSTCEFTLKQNQYVVLGSTGKNGGYVVYGDQYLTLWNLDTNQQVASNEDYYGSDNMYTGASEIYYSFWGTGSNRFQIREGCSGSTSCAALVAYQIEDYVMTAPTGAPTAYTKNLMCYSYYTEQTNSAKASSTNEYYRECQFELCPGQEATIGSCGGSDGGYCNGDQYLRLKNISNLQVTANDDGGSACYICSKMKYALSKNASGCSCFTIVEGCYGNGACSGQVSVAIVGAPPANTPTKSPFIYPTYSPNSYPTSYSYPTNSYPTTNSYPISSPVSVPTLPVFRRK